MSKLLPVALSIMMSLVPWALNQGGSISGSCAGSVLAASQRDIVDFNTQSLKYHDPDCIWAKRCTVHCIKITRAEAKKRGGIPCKVCGGGET